LCLVLLFTNVNSQEILTPLYHNHVISGYLKKHQQVAAFNKSAAPGDTLKLPVIDDFSAPGIFPDPTIWIDSNVFINPGFSSNPPSVGMATFDGLDKTGNPYNNSSVSQYGVTDKLESKPVNLFADDNGNPYTLADGITLSFYYQRRGLGDNPEFGDSLQLEFYQPDSAKWYWQWSMDGGTFDFNFIRIFVGISDPMYLKNGFRFRFRSYGSLTGTLDNWNLDYVILKKQIFPGDSLINDIGYRLPAHSLIKGFTSIPYDHYKYLGAGGQANLMKTVDTLRVFNLFNTASAPSQVNFRIYDQAGGLQYLYNTSGNGNIVIAADSLKDYGYPNPPFSYRYPDSIPGNYAEFLLVDNLASPNQDLNKNNDTIRYRQIFDNYYSYDDGSAEAGYSLINSPNGKLAYKIDLIKPDTMRGMYIHWNQMNANVSLKLFKMVVWQSLTPENIIFQELNQKPMYDDSINGFRYYVFSTGLPLAAGSYYIGLVQSAADALNLGFDRNINSNSKMFYNTTGNWLNSSIPGSFMFRPVFGDTVLTTGINDHIAEQRFTIYPNPADDYINITHHGAEGIYQYSITDLSGREIRRPELLRSRIDVSMLTDGFYFITIFNREKGYFTSEKLVISRQ